MGIAVLFFASAAAVIGPTEVLAPTATLVGMIGLTMIGIGLMYVVAAAGLWTMKVWGWFLSIIISIVDAVIAGANGDAISAGIAVAIIVVLLLTRRHFR